MSIDIDDLASDIATGIYGDDRMSASDLNAALSALAALVSEVERLRGEVERDRAAVVAWLRNEWEQGVGMFVEAARRSIDCIERGDHRREEEP